VKTHRHRRGNWTRRNRASSAAKRTRHVVDRSTGGREPDRREFGRDSWDADWDLASSGLWPDITPRGGRVWTRPPFATDERPRESTFEPWQIKGSSSGFSRGSKLPRLTEGERRG